MSGFQSPNYTQTPNDFFDSMLQGMKEAELKVTLYAVRMTFGFHRQSFRLSLTGMKKATGLSRQGVLLGAEAAERRGTLTRIKEGQGVTEWVINVVDQVVNVVDQTGQRGRPPSNKETIKETPGKKKEGAAMPPAITAYREIARRFPDKATWEDISRAVGEADADLAFWREVIHGYIACGWNKTNIKSMLEFYARREIPSVQRNGNGARPADDGKPVWMRGLERAIAEANENGDAQ